MIAKIFVGENRALHHIWRAAIFFALVTFAFPFAAQPAVEWVVGRFHMQQALSATNIAFGEGMNLVFALLATALFAAFERRGLGAYGLPLRRAFGAQTWEGFLTGIAMAGAVAAGMIALGGMQIHGLALTGEALALSALAWLGANVLVGLAEELWFRAYFLQSLWRSIGFWPAAIVIAAIFAALHYFYKDGENIWDVITLVSISMLLCFTVKRTGFLWFAVGFHIAFDFMQFFVIGTPNGNLIPQGRMLDVTFNGPAWLTGGVLGTEASWLMYPMIALVWIYVAMRYRPAAATGAAPAE
ncbi:MAG TPA: CPBP family intramembrane glutamic endopeptidase [Rhizomicrobium sp.]|nr:CPBP family intramembrane glutamic endopeptidase [Rhizomicrobium sp.]